MRDYTKALEAIQEATEHDTKHEHTKEIAQQEAKIQQAIWSQRSTETTEETLERAMRDPEVAVSSQFTRFFAFLGFSSPFLCCVTEHHERSCHAADPATSTV